MIAVSRTESTMDTTLTRPRARLRKAPFVAMIAISMSLACLGQPAAADNDGRRLRFLRMVVGRDRITVEGSETALDRLDAQFAKVAEPQHTVLEVAASDRDIEPTRYRNAGATAQQLCQRLGFREVRQIDPCPLGSKARKVGFVGPLVYGREIQLGLLIGTDGYPEMVRTSRVRLKRRWLKVKADLRISWITYADAKWRFTLELLDANRQVLAKAQQTLVTRRILRGAAALTGRRLDFDLGWWANVRAAREFVVTIAKVSVRNVTVNGQSALPVR